MINRLHGRSIEGKAVLTWYKSKWGRDLDAKHGTADAAWHTKIYRRIETGFDRNGDYADFFLGINAQGAELIHDGVLKPTNNRKFTFTDDSAKWRTTYSYFIEVENAPPLGPIPLRPTDPEVYWSPQRLWSELKQLAADMTHGQAVELSHCGVTGAGQPIPQLKIGTRGPRLVLVGLIHPGEAGPELIVPALAQILAIEPNLFDRVQVLALPSVNMDARQVQAEGVPWYLRRTLTGIDLNRNFPADWETPALGYGLDSRDPDAMTYRGPAAGCAPETQAVMAALQASPPDVLLSYHALASLCSLPAVYPRATAAADDYDHRCRRCIEAFASGCFPDQRYDEKWAKPGTSSGSLPRWVHEQFNAPAFDLEMGGPDPEEVVLAQADLTDRPLLHRYQQMHANGLRAMLRMMGNMASVAT